MPDLINNWHQNCTFSIYIAVHKNQLYHENGKRKTENGKRKTEGRLKPFTSVLAIAMFCGMGGTVNGQWLPGWEAPDFYGGANTGTAVMRTNAGQIRDTQGNPCSYIKYGFENTPMGLFMREHSTISYTLTEKYGDGVTPDVPYRWDMNIQEAVWKDPIASHPAPGLANYYHGSVVAAQNVTAYHRNTYVEILPRVDLHIYGSKTGPRMQFVVRPNGDPNAIQLVFNGQDSIKVDIDGALKVFKGQRHIKLSQAIAFQVDQNNNITTVPWTGSYIHDQNFGIVRFNFGAYDANKPLIFQIGYPALMGGGEPTNAT